MSGITVERIGRRSYLSGNTYPIKEKIRDAGGHWDGDRRAWWLGKDSVARELAGLMACEPSPKKSRDGLLDGDRVAGKARYKGREYILVWEGQTKKGPAAKLSFTDGSKVFWADASEVEVTKRYREPSDGDRRGYGRVEAMTFGRLQVLRAKYAQKDRGDQPVGKCRESGCSNPADMDARHCQATGGYCGHCAYDNI